MKKNAIFVFLILLSVSPIFSQKYFTRAGSISFLSDAPLEKIDAHNQSASAVLDGETGQLEFAVLVKSFQFKKALMEEHFNENYMESSKYPKAKFKGKITEGEVNYYQIGTYQVMVSGELTMHGVTQQVQVPATLTTSKAGILAEASFDIALADYRIKIPKMVKGKIAETVQIQVKSQLEPFKK